MSALADEIQAALRPLIEPLESRLAAVQSELQALRDRAGEELLTYAVAAADLGMSPGAFRQAAASDPTLRKLIKGTGRLKKIRRADARAWFESRQKRKWSRKAAAGGDK